MEQLERKEQQSHSGAPCSAAEPTTWCLYTSVSFMAYLLFRLHKSRAKTNERDGSNIPVSCISSLLTDKERGFEAVNRDARFNSGYHNL